MALQPNCDSCGRRVAVSGYPDPTPEQKGDSLVVISHPNGKEEHKIHVPKKWAQDGLLLEKCPCSDKDRCGREVWIEKGEAGFK